MCVYILFFVIAMTKTMTLMQVMFYFVREKDSNEVSMNTFEKPCNRNNGNEQLLKYTVNNRNTQNRI